jgi:hypothetical protein
MHIDTDAAAIDLTGAQMMRSWRRRGRGISRRCLPCSIRKW